MVALDRNVIRSLHHIRPPTGIPEGTIGAHQSEQLVHPIAVARKRHQYFCPSREVGAYSVGSLGSGVAGCRICTSATSGWLTPAASGHRLISSQLTNFKAYHIRPGGSNKEYQLLEETTYIAPKNGEVPCPTEARLLRIRIQWITGLPSDRGHRFQPREVRSLFCRT